MRVEIPPTRHQVRCEGGTVEVHASSWIEALARSLSFFEIDSLDPGEWSAMVGPGGEVTVLLPGGQSVDIRPLTQRVVAVPASLEEAFEPFRDEDTPTAQWPPPPDIEMPTASLARSGVIFEPEALSERLFDLSGQLASEEPDVVARVMLDLVVQELIRCAWAAVYRGTVDDEDLRCIAGTGVGDALVGWRVPFETGLVGACHHSGMVLRTSALHGGRLAHLPAQVAEGIRELLCVPVPCEDGRTWGVLMVVDPAEGTPEQAVSSLLMVAGVMGRLLV